MSHLQIIIIALLLDGLIGDPDPLWRKYPHPAALMGRAVGALERHFNTGNYRRGKGIAALGLLLGVAWLVGQLIATLDIFGLFDILLATILLAQNSLMRHVSAVARGLETSLAEGRTAVAMIVGRDARNLDRNGVIRSAIESLAENFSDAVVAPVFWFLVFGLPGIMVYKMANTADSMIGYRSDRYRAFGWAAARFDDLLNWIPARISGALICLAHGSRRAFAVMLRDSPKHRSPNAGWPESATAAVIGIAISGPRIYDGHKTDDGFVNAEGRFELEPADIDRALAAIWRVWAVMLALLGLALLLQKGAFP